MVEYFGLFFTVALVIIVTLHGRSEYDSLKRSGIKVPGVIISNKDDDSGNEFYRLGGNINTPTVRFTTKEGIEITGRPVLGFVTQYEIRPPVEVVVHYSRKDPEKFCVTMG